MSEVFLLGEIPLGLRELYLVNLAAINAIRVLGIIQINLFLLLRQISLHLLQPLQLSQLINVLDVVLVVVFIIVHLVVIVELFVRRKLVLRLLPKSVVRLSD